MFHGRLLSKDIHGLKYDPINGNGGAGQPAFLPGSGTSTLDVMTCHIGYLDSTLVFSRLQTVYLKISAPLFCTKIVKKREWLR